MIENKNDASRNLEKALQALEQAKQRVANEKKKQNEKKRKAENHHKYIGGGAMLMKHFAKLDQNKVRFIEDIHANAKGYEYLSNQRRLRNIRRG